MRSLVRTVNGLVANCRNVKGVRNVLGTEIFIFDNSFIVLSDLYFDIKKESIPLIKKKYF